MEGVRALTVPVARELLQRCSHDTWQPGNVVRHSLAVSGSRCAVRVYPNGVAYHAAYAPGAPCAYASGGAVVDGPPEGKRPCKNCFEFTPIFLDGRTLPTMIEAITKERQWPSVGMVQQIGYVDTTSDQCLYRTMQHFLGANQVEEYKTMQLLENIVRGEDALHNPTIEQLSDLSFEVHVLITDHDGHLRRVVFNEQKGPVVVLFMNQGRLHVSPIFKCALDRTAYQNISVAGEAPSNKAEGRVGFPLMPSKLKWAAYVVTLLVIWNCAYVLPECGCAGEVDGILGFHEIPFIQGPLMRHKCYPVERWFPVSSRALRQPNITHTQTRDFYFMKRSELQTFRESILGHAGLWRVSPTCLIAGTYAIRFGNILFCVGGSCDRQASAQGHLLMMAAPIILLILLVKIPCFCFRALWWMVNKTRERYESDVRWWATAIWYIHMHPDQFIEGQHLLRKKCDGLLERKFYDEDGKAMWRRYCVYELPGSTRYYGRSQDEYSILWEKEEVFMCVTHQLTSTISYFNNCVGYFPKCMAGELIQALEDIANEKNRKYLAELRDKTEEPKRAESKTTAVVPRHFEKVDEKLEELGVLCKQVDVFMKWQLEHNPELMKRFQEEQVVSRVDWCLLVEERARNQCKSELYQERKSIEDEFLRKREQLRGMSDKQWNESRKQLCAEPSLRKHLVGAEEAARSALRSLVKEANRSFRIQISLKQCVTDEKAKRKSNEAEYTSQHDKIVGKSEEMIAGMLLKLVEKLRMSELGASKGLADAAHKNYIEEVKEQTEDSNIKPTDKVQRVCDALQNTAELRETYERKLSELRSQVASLENMMVKQQEVQHGEEARRSEYGVDFFAFIRGEYSGLEDDDQWREKFSRKAKEMYWEEQRQETFDSDDMQLYKRLRTDFNDAMEGFFNFRREGGENAMGSAAMMARNEMIEQWDYQQKTFWNKLIPESHAKYRVPYSHGRMLESKEDLEATGVLPYTREVSRALYLFTPVLLKDAEMSEEQKDAMMSYVFGLRYKPLEFAPNAETPDFKRLFGGIPLQFVQARVAVDRLTNEKEPLWIAYKFLKSRLEQRGFQGEFTPLSVFRGVGVKAGSATPWAEALRADSTKKNSVIKACEVIDAVWALVREKPERSYVMVDRVVLEQPHVTQNGQDIVVGGGQLGGRVNYPGSLSEYQYPKKTEVQSEKPPAKKARRKGQHVKPIPEKAPEALVKGNSLIQVPLVLFVKFTRRVETGVASSSFIVVPLRYSMVGDRVLWTARAPFHEGAIDTEGTMEVQRSNLPTPFLSRVFDAKFFGRKDEQGNPIHEEGVIEFQTDHSYVMGFDLPRIAVRPTTQGEQFTLLSTTGGPFLMSQGNIISVQSLTKPDGHHNASTGGEGSSGAPLFNERGIIGYHVGAQGSDNLFVDSESSRKTVDSVLTPAAIKVNHSAEEFWKADSAVVLPNYRVERRTPVPDRSSPFFMWADRIKSAGGTEELRCEIQRAFVNSTGLTRKDLERRVARFITSRVGDHRFDPVPYDELWQYKGGDKSPGYPTQAKFGVFGDLLDHFGGEAPKEIAAIIRGYEDEIEGGATPMVYFSGAGKMDYHSIKKVQAGRFRSLCGPHWVDLLLFVRYTTEIMQTIEDDKDLFCKCCPHKFLTCYAGPAKKGFKGGMDATAFDKTAPSDLICEIMRQLLLRGGATERVAWYLSQTSVFSPIFLPGVGFILAPGGVRSGHFLTALANTIALQILVEIARERGEVKLRRPIHCYLKNCSDDSVLFFAENDMEGYEVIVSELEAMGLTIKVDLWKGGLYPPGVVPSFLAMTLTTHAYRGVDWDFTSQTDLQRKTTSLCYLSQSDDVKEHARSLSVLLSNEIWLRDHVTGRSNRLLELMANWIFANGITREDIASNVVCVRSMGNG